VNFGTSCHFQIILSLFIGGAANIHGVI